VTAAQEEGPEFGLLVELAAVLGARPIQLRRLRVGDLQADRADPRLMMPSSAKGRRKTITRRPLPISAALALRLGRVASGPPASARLRRREHGAAWQRGDHARRFQRTVERLGLDPAEVTIYALRHSSIVRALLAGVPTRLAASNHDTGVAQLERTYSKHIADHTDALTRQALLDLDAPTDNVQMLARRRPCAMPPHPSPPPTPSKPPPP